MAHNSTAITRRAAIILGSVAGLAGAASGTTAATSRSPDLTSKAGCLRAFMRMRGMIDDGLVISFVTGIYYGVVDNTLTPLYGIASVTFGRYRQSSPLSYAGVECEQAFYTDLETGKVLDDWRNPYTNEIVKVPEYRSEPKTFKIDENLVFSSAVPGPDVHFEQSVAPPIILGNDVWFTETIAVSGHLPGRTQPLRYQEMKTMHARLGELASAGAKKRRFVRHACHRLGKLGALAKNGRAARPSDQQRRWLLRRIDVGSIAGMALGNAAVPARAC